MDCTENEKYKRQTSKNVTAYIFSAYAQLAGMAQNRGPVYRARAKVSEGSGSRIRFEINQVVASFHRPHPDKEAKVYQVRDAMAFLIAAGVST